MSFATTFLSLVMTRRDIQVTNGCEGRPWWRVDLCPARHQYVCLGLTTLPRRPAGTKDGSQIATIAPHNSTVNRFLSLFIGDGDIALAHMTPQLRQSDDERNQEPEMQLRGGSEESVKGDEVLADGNKIEGSINEKAVKKVKKSQDLMDMIPSKLQPLAFGGMLVGFLYTLLKAVSLFRVLQNLRMRTVMAMSNTAGLDLACAPETFDPPTWSACILLGLQEALRSRWSRQQTLIMPVQQKSCVPLTLVRMYLCIKKIHMLSFTTGARCGRDTLDSHEEVQRWSLAAEQSTSQGRSILGLRRHSF